MYFHIVTLQKNMTEEYIMLKQEKTGKFIAERRKKQEVTQKQLAAFKQVLIALPIDGLVCFLWFYWLQQGFEP